MLIEMYSESYPNINFVTDLVKLASNGDRPIIAAISGFIVVSLTAIAVLRNRSAVIFLVAGVVVMAGCIVFLAGGIAYAAIWADAFKHMTATAPPATKSAPNESMGTTASTAIEHPARQANTPQRDSAGQGMHFGAIYAPNAERWRDVPEAKSSIRVRHAPAD